MIKFQDTVALVPLNVRKGKPAFALQNPKTKKFLSYSHNSFVYSPYDAAVFNSFENAMKFIAKIQEHLRQQFITPITETQLSLVETVNQ